MIASLKGFRQHGPHGVSLSASDQGVRKDLVIFSGHLIEDKSCWWLCDGDLAHASTSIRVECRPARAI
jgi:hypothetical protein